MKGEKEEEERTITPLSCWDRAIASNLSSDAAVLQKSSDFIRKEFVRSF